MAPAKFEFIKKALSVGSGKLTSELNGIVKEINKKEQSFENYPMKK